MRHNHSGATAPARAAVAFVVVAGAWTLLSACNEVPNGGTILPVAHAGWFAGSDDRDAGAGGRDGDGDGDVDAASGGEASTGSFSGDGSVDASSGSGGGSESDSSVTAGSSRAKEQKQRWRHTPPVHPFWTRWHGDGADWSMPSDDDLFARPLLSLVMILKDENASIAETIASVKPYVDRYTILDTGSTDGTQDTVRRAFGDVPGEVIDGPFGDFSSARNRVLRLAGTQSVFTITLNGDEFLENGDELRDFLENHRSVAWVNAYSGHEAYNVRIKFNTAEFFDLTRVYRTDFQWFYNGVTHEYACAGHGRNAPFRIYKRPAALEGAGTRDVGLERARSGPWGRPVPRPIASDPQVFHDTARTGWSDRLVRFAKDAELLRTEYAREATQRTAFYLAQSYHMLDNFTEAIVWYDKVREHNGWDEEVFEATLRKGKCLERLTERPISDAVGAWLEAWQMAPHRREPLLRISKAYTDRDMHHLGYLFAERASHIAYPNNVRLFIDRSAYETDTEDLMAVNGFFAGFLDEGQAAAAAVFRKAPNKRRERNLKCYIDPDMRQSGLQAAARGKGASSGEGPMMQNGGRRKPTAWGKAASAGGGGKGKGKGKGMGGAAKLGQARGAGLGTPVTGRSDAGRGSGAAAGNGNGASSLHGFVAKAKARDYLDEKRRKKAEHARQRGGGGGGSGGEGAEGAEL